MRDRTWLVGTVLALVGVFCLNLTISYVFDVYGVLRSPRGRRLAASGLHESNTDDRIAKYLLNRRYVPSNFDGLMIGSSTTANWDPDLIKGYRIYNESLANGNAAEEALLVDQALPNGHFRFAIVGLSPYIMGTYDYKQGLGEVKLREAFGSINSYGEMGAKALVHLHLQPATFFYNGRRELFVRNKLMSELPTWFFKTDPVAIARYRSMVEKLQTQGATIVYVVPPLYRGMADADRARLKLSLSALASELPAAPIIDFTKPEFEEYNANRRNFSDGLHVSTVGAEKIVKLLNQKLQEVLPTSGETRH